MKKIVSMIAASSLALQLMPLVAFATSHEGRQEVRQQAQDARQENRQETQGARQEKRQETQDARRETRQQTQEGRQEKRQEGQDARQQKRDEAQDARQQKRDEAQEARKQAVETRKQELEVKRTAMKEELQKKREEFKAKAETRKEELKKKIGEKRAANIEKFFNQMVEKFDATIARLKSFADRTDERIQKAKDAGKDVTDAESKLLTAREKIGAVETALADAKISYSEAVKNEDLKEAFKEVREIVGGVKVKAKEAQQSLVDAVTALKGVSGASTTPAPAPEPAPAPTPEPTPAP